MLLNVNRILCDRWVLNGDQFEVVTGFWEWLKRAVFWFVSPDFYTEENRRATTLFKNRVLEVLGAERLQRICSRYSMDLDEMIRKGTPLLSRDVAKIVIGTKSVTLEDFGRFSELNRVSLASAIQALSTLFDSLWKIPPILEEISGKPTEWLSCFFFDPFLADRERLQLVEENPTDRFEVFMHNMVARVIKREMEVGTLIPAPNHPDGTPQFYYVSAKLVTARGMVSYILHPATRDTCLQPIRLFRGTSPRPAEIDGPSTVITDLEKDLGRSSYESGNAYERLIEERRMQPTIEGGHSLGAVQVQYRLANMNHIEKAYLYCSPGIPEEEVEKFNRKNPAVRLIIRRTETDELHRVGEVHLGYRAPSRVEIDFLKFHAPQNQFFGPNPHVVVWDRGPHYYGIEGGITPEARDRELYHKKNWEETLRSLIGPIIAKVLEWIRSIVRFLFGSRAEAEKGLKIGSIRDGFFQVDHFQLA